MRISHYAFGRITVDGQTYSSDIVVYPDRVDGSWWRKEGHKLCLDDLSAVLEAEPELLIIGTGNLGVLSVLEETLEHLESLGIEVCVLKTRKAVKLFNERAGTCRTVGAFHLTC